ncbi:MAG: hypothetical protein JSV63_00885 [Candidatus Aenigmatarchaeota archaeon]|nr:MAG: hypothetical protein JSV63_00885 [Candidatus Aenigmarchaeota archaeon]
MEGINWKRMGIALTLAGIFGFFCAWGTSNVEIPGFEMTMPYLLTIFYGRLLVGLVIGLAEHVKLVAGEMKNAAVRGGILGAIVTVVISFYGGAGVFILAGIIYGIITDVLATRFGKK